MFKSISVWSGLLLLLWVSGAARAVELADGLRVVRSHDGPEAVAVVERDGVRVALVPPLEWPDTITDVWLRRVPGQGAVDVTWVPNCAAKVGKRFEAHVLRAMVEHATGLAKAMSEAALVHFEAAVTLVPDEPVYRVAWVDALLASGRNDKALEVLVATPPRARLMVAYFGISKQPWAPLLQADAVRSWRSGKGPVTLPAYDPTHRLLVVEDWDANAMAEGVGSRSATVLDADTGARLFTGLSEEHVAGLAGALGFEGAFAVTPGETHDGRERVRLGGMTVVGGKVTKVFAERKVIGSVRRSPWELQDGLGSLGAAVFEDLVLVLGDYNIGDGCGAHLGARFTLVPLTKPGPVAHQAWAATNRARRHLLAGRVNEAQAAIQAPVIQADPGVQAMRVLVDAVAGRVDDARKGVVALAEPWKSLVLHHPLAAAAFGNIHAAAHHGAARLPVFDPILLEVVMVDPARPAGVVFVTPTGSTWVGGIDVSSAFLTVRGFHVPLGVVKATDAAEGDWRAVFPGPSEQRLACAEPTATWTRGGTRVGKGLCDGATKPDKVWFFYGAVVWSGQETIAVETKGDTDHLPVFMPRVIFGDGR